MTARSDITSDHGNQGVIHSFTQSLSQTRVLYKADFQERADATLKHAARKVSLTLQRTVPLRF